MNWKFLLVKKALLARIPFADQLRLIKRKIFGYPPREGNIELTIQNYERIKYLIEKSKGSLDGLTILEIGSGWFPIIPILLVRDGAKKVFMSDLNVHMDDITFRETSEYLKKRYPNDEFIKNIENFKSLPIEYLAPFNESIFPDKSLDVIMSRAVLEHISKSNIYNLFSSLYSKVSDEGIMIHLIDHSDHFEHYDKSISRIDFLTRSDEYHVFINFLIKDGENRMIHKEYHQVFIDSGFEVISEETDFNQEVFEQINNLALIYPYSKMPPEQLSILTSIYVLKPALSKAIEPTIN